MSWTELAPPPAPDKGKRHGAVTATVSPGGGRFRQRLTLTVRPALLDGGLAWWREGAGGVAVLRGHGEHAGMLRVTPGGPHALRLLGGQAKHKRPVGLLLMVPGMPTDGHKPLVLEHDHGDGWLEVVLPDWARSGVVPVQSANGFAPAKPPRVSIMDRVPDPVLKSGRATGAVR